MSLGSGAGVTEVSVVKAENRAQKEIVRERMGSPWMNELCEFEMLSVNQCILPLILKVIKASLREEVKYIL